MAAHERHTARRRLAAALSLGFLRIVSWLPLPLARGLALVLARVAWYAVPRIRRVGLKNLDLAYGDSLSAGAKRRILRGAVRNVALVAADFSRLPRFNEDPSLLPVRVEGFEKLREVGNAIYFSGHLGNWELLGPALARVSPPVAGVVRPLDNPALNAVVDRYRNAGGFTTLAKDKAGGEMVRRLREGWTTGVLVDQSPRENGAPVTFFGQPCWGTIAPAMLAWRTGLPVIPGFVMREADGGYVFELGDPVEMVRTGDLLGDLQVNTQRCQDVVEAMVRRHPDQWLWFHRRWKARPRLEEEWQARRARARKREGTTDTEERV